MAIGLGSLLIYVDFNPVSFFEGITGLSARWTGSLVRGRYGSWRTVLYEMQMFLEASLPLAVALAFKKDAPIGRRVFSSLFVVWMILRQFSTGSRTPLVPIVLCIAAAIFWRSGARLRRLLIVFGIPIGLVGGYFVAAMIVAGRNEGKMELDAAKTEYVGTEMFRELLFVIHAEDHGMEPQYGLTYFTQLVNPIPRAIWPGKPVADAGLILARAYGAGFQVGRADHDDRPRISRRGLHELLVSGADRRSRGRRSDRACLGSLVAHGAAVASGTLGLLHRIGSHLCERPFGQLCDVLRSVRVVRAVDRFGQAEALETGSPAPPRSSAPAEANGRCEISAAWVALQVLIRIAPRTLQTFERVEKAIVRVTFLTTMPSPYSVDLFAAIEADGRITPRVLYMEMAAPDTYWGQVHLPESAEVLPGGWRNIGGGRVHWNSGVIRAIRQSRPELVVVSGYNSLTCQRAMRWLHRRRMPWVFWGEIPGMRSLGRLRGALRTVAQRPALRWPDAIAAIGIKAVEEYRRLAGPRMEIVNIPYHTDLKPFLDAPRKNSSDSVRVLYCGQLIARKGLRTLVRCVSKSGRRISTIRIDAGRRRSVTGLVGRSGPATFAESRHLCGIPTGRRAAAVFWPGRSVRAALVARRLGRGRQSGSGRRLARHLFQRSRCCLRPGLGTERLGRSAS